MLSGACSAPVRCGGVVCDRLVRGESSVVEVALFLGWWQRSRCPCVCTDWGSGYGGMYCVCVASQTGCWIQSYHRGGGVVVEVLWGFQRIGVL